MLLTHNVLTICELILANVTKSTLNPGNLDINYCNYEQVRLSWKTINTHENPKTLNYFMFQLIFRFP